MHEKLNAILQALMDADLSCLNSDNIIAVSNETTRLLNIPDNNITEYDVACMKTIILISQIAYNNTDKTILFLDDGVYDLLLEKYKKYDSNFQVGAPVVKFDQNGEIKKEKEVIEPIIFLDNAEAFKEDSLYYEDLSKRPPINMNMFQSIERNSGKVISKRNVNIPHMYPKLVGSLDKCKFTLNKEAIERDAFEDDNVKIFERDFLGKHLQMGIIDMNTPFEMIAELKYDGVSIEADVTHEILSARSRGDANADIAADLSDILAGYRFPNAPELPKEEAFGMKFEAIITYNNLDRMSQLRGKYYKNSRNGIIGLLGSSDAYDYRDLITLVPLATSIEDIDRVTEIEFLNKYYNSGEYLRYSILRGTYTEILFQVYRFVKEAETMRPILPFMYDGVVISYRDPKIIQKLGRENSINKYSIAIKFNPLVREAIFTGYTYKVGQDGSVTPMIHYTPVEFYGTIHTKSSGHSYKRFMDLGLAVGDILQVEYTNDVMPYVTKPDIQKNRDNPNPKEVFPTNCPFCGAEIIINESGKSVYCPNKKCPERIVAKMTNMMAKLNLKDFGEETFRLLKTSSLSELMNYKYDDVACLGPNTSEAFLARINEIKTTPLYDYKIMGSIGFTGIAIETWKKILNKIPLIHVLNDSDEDLLNKLTALKGIGPVTAETIVKERHELEDDIKMITTLENIILSYGLSEGKTIRYTGCRPDDELTAYLTSKGCDARPDAGVTKNTNILVVPYEGFSSSKTSKAGPDTLIVDISEFKQNLDKYIL